MHDRSISARPRWATAAALALAISFGAAGCGSDDPTSSGDSDTTVIGDVDSAAADAFCQSTDALNTQISSVAAAGGRQCQPGYAGTVAHAGHRGSPGRHAANESF